MMHDISKYKTAEDLQRSFREERNNDMNELTTYSSYDEYKKTLDTELKAQAEGFVRVGYLLKVARDTDILLQSGYKSVAEFAQNEYGLTKDVVSRYIAINDRYSENGYSDRLQVRYENFGYSKLTEMLTLPDEIIAEIEPSLTRKEIQEIKREIAEEEEITPLEVMAEAAADENVRDEESFTLRQRIWKAHFYTNKIDFRMISEKIGPDIAPVPLKSDIDTLIDILAPTGCQVLWSRIPGIGKIMISIKGKDVPIVFTNTRDGSKIECSAKDIYYDLGEIYGQINKRAWERLYGEPFDTPEEEKKPEIIPDKPVETPKVEYTDNIVKAENLKPETKKPEESGNEFVKPELVEIGEAAAAEETEEELPKIEGEVVETYDDIVKPKETDGTPGEYEIVLALLAISKDMSHILSGHTTRNSPLLTDEEIKTLSENAAYFREQLMNLLSGRK